jgi:hypothetical protein
MATFAQTERLGFALRRLAEDLVTEQRRVRLLQREVRELKAQLAAARSTPTDDDRERWIAPEPEKAASVRRQ